MLDIGSMLRIALLSYGQAYPLTPDPLARPAETVTGGSVQRDGLRCITTETQDGRRAAVSYSIGNANRPILSVPEMVDSGKFVWVGSGGSGVDQGADLYTALRAYEAGAYLELKRDRGAFVLPTRVVPVYGTEEVDSALPLTASTSASSSSGVPWAPSAQLVAVLAAPTPLPPTDLLRAIRQHEKETKQQAKISEEVLEAVVAQAPPHVYRKTPGEPTTEARRIHCLTHVPFAIGVVTVGYVITGMPRQ